jgi:hypothetical protein
VRHIYRVGYRIRQAVVADQKEEIMNPEKFVLLLCIAWFLLMYFVINAEHVAAWRKHRRAMRALNRPSHKGLRSRPNRWLNARAFLGGLVAGGLVWGVWALCHWIAEASK